MREIVAQIVGWTGAILAGLTLLIIVNKAARETREALDRRRRALLEPRLFEYAGAVTGRSVASHLPQPLRRRDRRLAEAILLEMAHVVKGETRDRLTAAFESLGSVARAIRGLKSRRWWRRAEAAERLGLMRSASAVEPLVALMGDEAGEVRMRAARALGWIRGRTSIRPLIAALADPSRWSAIRVAEILINVGAEAVDELLAAWSDLPRHARISALDVLGRIRSLKSKELMGRCLSDEDADIRARAAHGLGLIGDPGSADLLLKALRDPEWPVRAMAAKSLGRLGGPTAIPALCDALKDRQWWVRANAGEALRGLGPPGLEALVRMLDAEDTFARHQAVVQLEESRIVDQYVIDLVAPDPDRRAAAIAFVEKIIALQRVGHLTEQAIANAQEGVRRALVTILKRPAEGGS
ncbi:MAG: HEAT repeat domain-containing protein [Candidatus Polarisedimenticolia bacterium]